MKFFPLVTTFCLALSLSCFAQKSKSQGAAIASFYPMQMEDSLAVYFTPKNFDIKADGKTDVSDALQLAINQVKKKYNFGVLFIPEGTYLISKTIYIPAAVRLIGYGKTRPLIVLAKHSPGYQQLDKSDKGWAKYMFWFTSNLVAKGGTPDDAGASTFYSAMSNINLKIEDGNPQAVALRTHYAQHSFIAHVNVYAGNGKAGMYDVGNEMEDVHFFGGDYGIYTTKTSPGWQFMMLDTYFEGQKKAAIKTQEAGLTIVRMHAKNVPVVIAIDSGFWEKLFMKDCLFDNVGKVAIVISNAGNPNTQINLRNINCRNVPVFASYRESKKSILDKAELYSVSDFTNGLVQDGINAEPVYKTTASIEPLKVFPSSLKIDIPVLPSMDSWVNLKSLGAKGDGRTDDTKAIQSAIDKYNVIYVPQGWYRVSQTIKLNERTVLIGLNPISTQFFLAENTEAFGGFGGPVPLIETSMGGTNIISGIGLSTGASNPRAVACKWMAGAASYLNDVKFIGGHGSMGNTKFGGQESPYKMGTAGLWDTQYWSLWITNGGGGIFKNIWTANTYATNGVYISNTATKGNIYGLSVEHHVHNEVRFKNVSGWSVFALQTEEESRESSDCQPIELENCDHMLFANLYMFRVIRVAKPYPYAIRNWYSKDIEFLNVHNYAQTKYTSTNTVFDMQSGEEVCSWELAQLLINDDNEQKKSIENPVRQLATGFQFAEGMCSDGKGNIYFCESGANRIYQWLASTKTIRLLGDYPWQPLSLACDKNDNLLVVFKYEPKSGYLIKGKPEVFRNPPDAAGTSFSGWGNSGFATWVYSIDPSHPDESIRLLRKTPMGSIKNIYKALYPAHRWRDYHDFNLVVVDSAKWCWVAPDGVTVIPIVYDLARATSLAEAFPGKPLYISDEYNERTVSLSVSREGYVSNRKDFAEKGNFATATNGTGNVFIADGQVYVFNKNGEQIKEIKIPERPTGLIFGGRDHQTLFVTGHQSLFKVEILEN
ncbi:glycosyl hydrolase family 28-related protein [Arachidicoccus sp.]|uniref:glycosyl hydrolase family 28-related protein n=1 Tax=Arachidicoccus sp. TaxID=1872624 RepID=UPI003D1C42B8